MWYVIFCSLDLNWFFYERGLEMALYVAGAGVAAISGKIAGSVFSHNRYGAYIRPWRMPVNPKSNRQVAIRTIMMYLAEQWRESPMTAVIRDAWQTYANSVSWANRMGQDITLLGYNMFIRNNAAMLTAGGNLITAAPTDLGLPPGDPTFAITISAATQKLSVTFDDGFDWVDEDAGYLSVHMCRPASASHNFFGGPFRHAGAINGDAITPPTSPDATIDCPFTATEGQRTVIEARIIRADSRCSTLFRSDMVDIAA